MNYLAMHTVVSERLRITSHYIIVLTNMIFFLQKNSTVISFSMIAKIKVFVCRRREVGSFQMFGPFGAGSFGRISKFFWGWKNTSNLANIKNYIEFFQKKGHITKFLLQFMFESIL